MSARFPVVKTHRINFMHSKSEKDILLWKALNKRKRFFLFVSFICFVVFFYVFVFCVILLTINKVQVFTIIELNCFQQWILIYSTIISRYRNDYVHGHR